MDSKSEGKHFWKNIEKHRILSHNETFLPCKGRKKGIEKKRATFLCLTCIGMYTIVEEYTIA